MSCSRTATLDLTAFQTDRGSPEWAEFVDHYPRCSECSAAVAELGGLLVELEALGSGSAHPDADRLADFVVALSSIPSSERASIDRHVAGCADCREALAVLRGFDFAALPARESSRQLVVTPARSRLAVWIEPLFSWPSTPVLAAAVVIVLVVGVTFALRPGPGPGAGRDLLEPTTIADRAGASAERPIPTGASDNRPEPPPLAEPEPIPTRLAEAEAPAVAVPENESEAPADGVASEPPVELAESDASPEPLVLGEEIVLAANFPQSPPSYHPDPLLLGGSLATVRTYPLARGALDTLPAIRALAPEHAGATASASPTLYWHLSSTSPVPVEVALLDEEGIEPLLRTELEPPVAAGLHSIDLAAHGVRLAPGETYTWLVLQVPDRDQRERDVFASAAIRHAPPAAAARDRIASVPLEQRAHVQAELGYWYDAFATVTALRERHPAEDRLREFEASLLEQVGLDDVAEPLRR